MARYFWQKPVMLGLFVLFVAINILDFVSSVIGVGEEGLIETNWFANLLTPSIGLIDSFVLVKAIFLGLISLTVLISFHTKKLRIDDDTTIAGLVLLNVIGFVVLSNNFSYLGWVL